jgi:hypothetical protein
MNTEIPPPILAAVAKAASEMFTRTEMCNAFEESGFPSGAGVGSSKLEAARAYLRTLAANHDGWTLLERMVRRVTEEPYFGSDEPAAWAALRGRVKEILAGEGYAYVGGRLVRRVPVAPARSLEEGIRRHDMQAVLDEFERALANVNADPPAAATAACAILESVFKTVLGDDGVPLPSDQSIGPLWKLLRDHLELAPEKALKEDLRTVAGGLAAIATGVGAFRTRAGSAHGRGRDVFRPDQRHARLVVHAAQTLASFVIETWEMRKPPAHHARHPGLDPLR